jgi:ribonuclease BN (tRNA processing enzyme)
MHLTGREAGECAEQAGVGRLIVTHIPPWNDAQRSLAEAASAFHGPIDLAQPGLTVDV